MWIWHCVSSSSAARNNTLENGMIVYGSRDAARQSRYDVIISVDTTLFPDNIVHLYSYANCINQHMWKGANDVDFYTCKDN